MARPVGGFTLRTLVQALSFKPRRAKSFSLSRGGRRRSDLSKGSGGQHNGVGTKSLDEKILDSTSTSKIQKENKIINGNGHVIKDHSTTKISGK